MSTHEIQARFKDFLVERGMLQPWYDVEQKVEKEALLKWCWENDIAVSDVERPTKA